MPKNRVKQGKPVTIKWLFAIPVAFQFYTYLLIYLQFPKPMKLKLIKQHLGGKFLYCHMALWHDVEDVFVSVAAPEANTSPEYIVKKLHNDGMHSGADYVRK